ATTVDRYGDFMGYAFLSVPKTSFQLGRPLRIRIVGESAGSRTWYMTFETGLESRVSLRGEQAIIREGTAEYQTIRVELLHFGEPTDATIRSEDKTIRTRLVLGYNTVQLPVRAVESEKEIRVKVDIAGKTVMQDAFQVEPVRRKTMYLLHHSHVDIGYTHVQTDVERIQWGHLEKSIELAWKSADYPPGSRYKWNAEVLWAVDSYFRKAPLEKQEQLANAIRRGWIGLDGMFANELTGLCRPEELFHLFDAGRRISQRCDVPLEAAMITDIPGYSWGLVPAMAQSGIKYLSIGPNSGHRVGTMRREWSDRPFYWVSPSGEEKILCWVAGKGYSWFHTGLGATQLKKRLEEKPILDYLEELEASSYPYDIVTFRYNIGSDNGPPDSTLADKVKAWNEKYVTPRIVIATTGEAFRAFEQAYGERLPVVEGDFTGYWEDGAASSARETAMVRNTAERLVQAEILWAMKNPSGFPQEAFEEAWRNVLLYDEHTWGSWNSISAPEDDFTKQQWEIKKSYAVQASEQTDRLFKNLTGGRSPGSTGRSIVDIYNTNSWTRSDLVIFSPEYSGAGDCVVDSQGNPVPSQRLSTGEFVFWVEGVPPLGAKRFVVTRGRNRTRGRVSVDDSGLSNGVITVKIDKTTGAVSTFRWEDGSVDLVDSTEGMGWNDYFYVAGRSPEHPRRAGTPIIAVKEKGPLVGSIIIRSDAPGCRAFIREIRIIDGCDRVDIINTIDKEKVYEPEGVHLAFPFRVPNGVMRMDVAWGMFRPEHDQLPGSCKNYFSVQRWVDVSNQDVGVTWATLDAPLVEAGQIACDPISFGWVEHVTPSQTLYSYVMNNYWETNYKAAQEGPTTFRYSMRPHGRFNPGAAERFGIERSQPLVVLPSDGKDVLQMPLFQTGSAKVIVTSIKPMHDGRGFLIRLFNAGGQPERVALRWGSLKPSVVYFSSPYEERGKRIDEPFLMPAYAIRTLRVEM
ncbi:MAG: glycoside hydrolase family 38 C-terminal domain-containing protein, partial [bacterium]